MGTSQIGATLAILGLGSMILPLFGLQFKIMALFGEPWIAGTIFMALGIGLIIIDRRQH